MPWLAIPLKNSNILCFQFFFPISSAVRCPLPVELLAACAPFAGMSSSVENQTNAFPLVVVLAVSFCAFCMVYPINHTSRKIILSWYELNYIYLISQNMPLICISMSILNVAFFFFWICLDICMCFTTIQFLVCIVAKRKRFHCWHIIFLEMFFSSVPCTTCFSCLSVQDADVKCLLCVT